MKIFFAIFASVCLGILIGCFTENIFFGFLAWGSLYGFCAYLDFRNPHTQQPNEEK
jgi:hypothetical protein